MTEPGRVLGVSRLDSRVLLGDAGLAMAMVAAGAERLVDLRGETRPPGLPVPIDHFPIMDLEPDQDELIARAAAHVAALAGAGTQVGVYCQAGISRTAAVAIGYLLLGGATLAACATEKGQSVDSNGAENFVAGALPPPGFYALEVEIGRAHV